MPTYLPDIRPDWLKPENKSVLDSPMVSGLRNVLNLLGLNDPNSAVLGMAAPLESPAVKMNRVLRGLLEGGRPEIMRTPTGHMWAEPIEGGIRTPSFTRPTPSLEIKPTNLPGAITPEPRPRYGTTVKEQQVRKSSSKPATPKPD